MAGRPPFADRFPRRRFLGAGAGAVTALTLSPSLLTGCGAADPPRSDRVDSDRSRGPSIGGTLRVSNWPLYMADGFVAAFQTATGVTVDYKEDINDDQQWLDQVSEPLTRRTDIGADLVVPGSSVCERLHDAGWLNDISDRGVPNKRNVRADLRPADGWFSAPYLSGLVGLAYNRAATGRDIHRIDDLWDPAFRGRVSLLSDTRDGLGMIMLAQGGTPAEPGPAAVTRAIDTVRDQKDRGQIRRFTGSDYADELASGVVVAAQAYSGDIVALQANNPQLRFVVPEAGATVFVDSMAIPYTSRNQPAAEAWIDHVYHRANYARLVAAIQYVPVLSDMTDDLARIDPTVAANPLINPPQSTLDRCAVWGPLSDNEFQTYRSAYAAVTEHRAAR